MSGIDISKIDDLIMKCEGLLDSINANSKNVVSAISKIDESYDGKALDSIYASFLCQNSKLDNILSILESYLLYLKSVRKSYVLQDMRFSQQINELDIRDQF